MRSIMFAMLLGAAMLIGCDDDTTTNTPAGPSSGSSVAPPPPVTPTTQLTTHPARPSSSDLIDEHRKTHNLPTAAENFR